MRRRVIDLAGSTAYSDSHSDLPFLEAVGNPVAVNPDRRLRLIARRRGWPILEFREHPLLTNCGSGGHRLQAPTSNARGS